MAGSENSSGTLVDGSEALIDHECTQYRAHGSKQEAIDYCRDCKQFICKLCRIHHVRNMKTHTLVGVASLQLSETSLPTVRPVPDVAKCQYHPDRDIVMYCGTHDMVFCYCCIAKEHRSCSDVKEIEDVAHTSNLSTLQSVVAKITRVSKQLHSTKLEMTNDRKQIQKTRTSLLDEIKALRKQFNKHLDTLELKIIAELDEEQAKLEKEIGNDITAVAYLIIASDKSKPFMTSHLDEKQIFITEKLGQTVLADANNFLKRANELKHLTLKFKPNDSLCAAIEKSERIGKINIIDTKQKRIKRRSYTVESINDIYVRVSSDTLCCINNICQLSDGSILVIDETNKKTEETWCSAQCE